MFYVIQHRTTGAFAAVPGREKSYSDRLQDAQAYLSAEEAGRNCCHDSEWVVRVVVVKNNQIELE